jgi:steroid delta-isomerase-like uncharacterized protein
MSVDSNKDLVRRLHQTVMTDRKLDDVAKFVTDPLVDHSTPGEQLSLEDYKRSLGAYFEAFPDFKEEIADLTGEDDFVVCRLELTGTQKGSFMGTPPSGKAFKIGSIQTYRVAGDKIVERWTFIDLMKLRTQLGIQN